MPAYRYLLIRAKDGEPLGELPASSVTFTETLTGDGSFECSLPVEHPMAGDLVDPGAGREVAAIRSEPGLPDTCEWNGPIVQLRRSIDGQGGTVQLGARSPLFYLSRRVTEGARNFGRPVLNAVENLVDTAQGKVGNPKPNGLLYRFTLTKSPANGGPAKVWQIGGADRIPILDVIQDLSDDDVAGFDYRMRYTYNPTGLLVGRVLELGHPTLGVDRSAAFVLEVGAGLLSYTDEADVTRAANRVHVLGAGAGTGARRAVALNGSHASGSGVLLEAVVDRSNVASQATLNAMAGAYRKTFAPPTRVISASYRPSTRLPVRFAELGDTVRLRVAYGGTVVDLKRRIVARTTVVDDAGAERVDLTLNNPLDAITS